MTQTRTLTNTRRQCLQVRAFHSLYRKFRRADGEFRRSREEDFVEALVATSDKQFEKADQSLIQQWVDSYSSRHTGEPEEVVE
jgi:hypothetical protein